MLVMVCFMIGAVVASVYAIVFAIQKQKLKEDVKAVQTLAEQRAAEKAKLEVLLAELQKRARGIGLAYKPASNGISSILDILQDIIGTVQQLGCKETTQIFMQSKDQIIASLKEQAGGNPIPCSKITEETKAETERLAAQMKEESPNVDPVVIQGLVTALWDAVSKEICNKDGNVDFIMLDNFITSLYKSFCWGQ